MIVVRLGSKRILQGSIAIFAMMSLSIGIQLLRQALTDTYPYGGPKRFHIPNCKINWSTSWAEYDPPVYTSPSVLARPPWADPPIADDQAFQPKWNSLDGLINRVSFTGAYEIDKDGYPLNPVGRTGVKGRGKLGRWGPNHACDPIVTRWKPFTSSKILQFIGIQRKDSEEWAIPGGMVDPGENVTTTCEREFLEEVFSIEESTSEESKRLQQAFKSLFENGVDIYKGYVDDPRNTDNAWMETNAINFHVDESSVAESTLLALSNLKAGSDALNAKWIDINTSLKLYANHRDFIKKVAEMYEAWE